MKQLTVGSLFSGIGGIDLGLERAGMRTVWFSEIDPYASRVLAKHWPHVPNHGDITAIDFSTVEPVDVLAGGFPCQDISSSGAKEGIDGERSGLWGHYARAIGELRPRYILVENVRDLIVRGLGRVLGDLASLGYDAEWHCIPASYVGLPQARDRVWIVAYPDTWGSTRRPQRHRDRPLVECGNHHDRLGLAQHRARQGASRIRRMDDGLPNGVDRLGALGNAVVPQIPELIGGWIVEHAAATAQMEAA